MISRILQDVSVRPLASFKVGCVNWYDVCANHVIRPMRSFFCLGVIWTVATMLEPTGFDRICGPFIIIIIICHYYYYYFTLLSLLSVPIYINNVETHVALVLTTSIVLRGWKIGVIVYKTMVNVPHEIMSIWWQTNQWCVARLVWLWKKKKVVINFCFTQQGEMFIWLYKKRKKERKIKKKELEYTSTIPLRRIYIEKKYLFVLMQTWDQRSFPQIVWDKRVIHDGQGDERLWQVGACFVHERKAVYCPWDPSYAL